MIGIDDLWNCGDQGKWSNALELYWGYVKPENKEIEREMEAFDLLERIHHLNSNGWYDFLHDKYFSWKYTAPNRLATTRKWLEQYVNAGEAGIDQLYTIRKDLLNFDIEDILEGLETAIKIKGLGTAGASGLLALMYPQKFGTVDQFAVKALRDVSNLPEAKDVAGIKNPESLLPLEGALLIKIMRRKAKENNALFRTNDWTPRKIDKVLWMYGR